MKKHFVTLPDGNQLHYRRAGSGPPLIMLHPSPQSSAALIPAMQTFKDTVTCIAFDTPGYGLSDGLGLDEPAIPDYAPRVMAAIKALGIERFALYGAATGAQVAIQLAKDYPDQVQLLILDSNGHVTDEQRKVTLNGYFPDTSIRRDGGHLMTYWDMVRHLTIFFPWQSGKAADRVHRDAMPPEVIQNLMNDYMRAGPDYWKAYKTAFDTEDIAHARGVTVPTVMVRWQSSMVLWMTDAMIEEGLPESFEVLEAGPSLEDRYAVQVEALKQKYLPGAPTEPAPATSPDATGDQFENIYVDVPGGQLRVQVNFAGAGRPLMAIHDPAGSSHLVTAILKPFIGDRPVIAFDNPGNGESDAVIPREEISSESYARVLNAALDALGIEEIDIIGRYSGGPVAMEMHFGKPGRIKHIAMPGIPVFEPDEIDDMLANYTPSVAPQWDGSHLMTAWGIMRDQNLFWPWYNRTTAGIMSLSDAFSEPMVQMTDLRVRELLKIGDAYQNAYAAMFTYPMKDKLPQVDIPVLACHPSWESIAYCTDRAKQIDPRIETAELPADMGGWKVELEQFFER